jgi:hypothetical protein
MAFDFPAAPAIDEVYNANGVNYTWDGEVWRGGGAASGQYVLKVGDTMSGPLVLPAADPAIAEHSTHKKYVDEQIATFSLYQGTWQVAANVPDLNVPPNAPLNGYSWTAQTVDPNVPETAPATIPGIGGLIIVATDTIKYNATTLTYELVRGPVALAKMTIADIPPATPFHGQLWWESDTGRMFLWFDDGTSSQWVMVSGGGGGATGGITDAPVDGQPYERKDAGWVPATGGTGGITEAPIDGTPYSRQDAGWIQATAGGGGIADAPSDGTLYGRQDAAWAPVTTAAGVPEAPSDGQQYARKDAAWSVVKTSASVGAAFPTTPGQGDLHLLTTDASLYCWYDDGTSAQWIEVSAP